MRLAASRPQLALSAVADHLTKPLIEMSMAYGLAFREQMERRYERIVNARLEQSRKLEALGTLAAGIAHDFNNILGSIVGFAEMAADDVADGSAGKHKIQQILIASFRARDLVARMLAFARQSPAHPVPTDIVAETREALALLRGSLSPGVELSLETKAERAMVMADPSQIQQIVMNLCINAADAMNDRGAIFIRIEPVGKSGGTGADLAERVCLSVSDSGCGMTPEVLELVFDPFFTTKAPNKGSGLGLSVVYGIATQLGGAIEAQSCTTGSSTGTQFRVFLPLLGRELGAQKGMD
jgi:signal transduction histidine kinase